MIYLLIPWNKKDFYNLNPTVFNVNATDRSRIKCISGTKINIFWQKLKLMARIEAAQTPLCCEFHGMKYIQVHFTGGMENLICEDIGNINHFWHWKWDSFQISNRVDLCFLKNKTLYRTHDDDRLRSTYLTGMYTFWNPILNYSYNCA